MKHDLANILIKHKNPQRLAAHARRLQKLSASQSLSQTKRARSLATRSEIMALAAAAWKADIYLQPIASANESLPEYVRSTAKAATSVVAAVFALLQSALDALDETNSLYDESGSENQSMLSVSTRLERIATDSLLRANRLYSGTARGLVRNTRQLLSDHPLSIKDRK